MSQKQQSPQSWTTRICKNHNDSLNAYIYGATTHTRDQRADAETCLLFALCKKETSNTKTVFPISNASPVKSSLLLAWNERISQARGAEITSHFR